MSLLTRADRRMTSGRRGEVRKRRGGGRDVYNARQGRARAHDRVTTTQIHEYAITTTITLLLRVGLPVGTTKLRVDMAALTSFFHLVGLRGGVRQQQRAREDPTAARRRRHDGEKTDNPTRRNDAHARRTDDDGLRRARALIGCIIYIRVIR